MNRAVKNTLVFGVIFLALILFLQYLQNPNSQSETLSYSKFLEYVEDDRIETATVQEIPGAISITGDLTGDEDQRFETNIPANEAEYAEVLSLLRADTDIQVEEAESSGSWFSIVFAILPFIIIFILFFFLLNQAQGGGGGGRVMNFGKSKAKLYDQEKRRVTFEDVAGADEEKQELIEVVEFLKDPRKFSKLGARIPKGVLLVGPPGTGKTLLARAAAGEAGVPFFSISGSDFVEMFVGVGASRVRDLFENAKKNAPCIIFIDEIDAVGRQRGAGLGGGHDEREQTLNQLLVEMDGFSDNEGIIMIAATNRPDILDPALLRPGRFDRQITVDRPDVKGREAVLKVHARNKPLDSTVDLKSIAQRTPGFSGADLENLLNEAALVAARSNRSAVSVVDVEEAIDRVIAGPSKKSRVISEKERQIVAYHEAGHTIIGIELENADEVHKVTIVPRGNAGGYVVMLPKEDRYFMTKPELEDKIVGLLGGRVAEDVIFGEVSTGASNDFQRATGIARKMVMDYGMSDKLGPLQLGSNHGGQVFLGRDFQTEQNYSDAIAQDIDLEIRDIINRCYAKAKQILTDRKDDLELVAKTLLEVETLDSKQIRHLIKTREYLPHEPEEPSEPSNDDANDEAKKDEAAVKHGQVIDQPGVVQEAKPDVVPEGDKPEATPTERPNNESR
ncbi:ATP-dependent metallopeptidase FtsH/Yme1/Tma family protein [Exiguobacterium sp. SL-10]|uniref:ATP-dependent zinc metalloprotease FtsH n=1 Tax=unclassified Exiguobacterium TaxID=2644629 RepID=UPI00103D3CBC|nr:MULTISPECIES: ATP-dependent zinc metalloprotease FtsH [unclassified Exiguobacterium]TCI20255.1 ATP-dependent metallopeptidase FtsH/Yme1/Tma family protein [Exiguobacterium sp. SL-9]TCI28339.1 ATP-dependent metallopeptidase FtsH/Yme1/Tma family protein [Exiguobacterium sp. SL-10]